MVDPLALGTGLIQSAAQTRVNTAQRRDQRQRADQNVALQGLQQLGALGRQRLQEQAAEERQAAQLSATAEENRKKRFITVTEAIQPGMDKLFPGVQLGAEIPVTAALIAARLQGAKLGGGRGGGASGIKVSVARGIFGKDIIPEGIGDNEVLPPSTITAAISQSGKFSDFVKVLGFFQDRITGGLLPGAQQNVFQNVIGIQNQLGRLNKEGKVLVEIPPNVIEGFEDGGIFAAKKESLPNLLKLGARALEFGTEENENR